MSLREGKKFSLTLPLQEFSGESQRLLSQKQVVNKRKVGFSLPFPPAGGDENLYALSQDVMPPFPPRKKTHTHPPVRSGRWATEISAGR